MSSAPVIFDSYVLKCWADAARLQTLALEALADFLDAPRAPRQDADRD